jgi:hypothetical protein
MSASTPSAVRAITDTFVRHPVLALVVNLLLILVGWRTAVGRSSSTRASTARRSSSTPSTSVPRPKPCAAS